MRVNTFVFWMNQFASVEPSTRNANQGVPQSNPQFQVTNGWRYHSGTIGTTVVRRAIKTARLFWCCAVAAVLLCCSIALSYQLYSCGAVSGLSLVCGVRICGSCKKNRTFNPRSNHVQHVQMHSNTLKPRSTSSNTFKPRSNPLSALLPNFPLPNFQAHDP